MTKNETKDARAAGADSPTASEPGNGFGNFLKSTKVELDKVVWPSRQQLFSESAAVLLMVVAAATLVYLVDGLFGWLAIQVFQ